jgi:transposase
MATKIIPSGKIVFKPYEQHQFIRVPLNIESLIPSSHLVRIIDGVIEQLKLSDLMEYYPGGGRSSYHPKLMIKVWVYGYCTQVYTSRPLARALREQIPFIWLAGGQTPNFKTLSEFRGNRMEGMIDLIFKQVLVMLVEEGYVDLEDLYVDGSKWEANANRHKVVWSKNTARYKAAVLERVERVLREVADLQAAEDQRYGSRDLGEVGEGHEVSVVLNSKQVGECLASLNTLIAEASADTVRQRALKKAKVSLEVEEEKLCKYEHQEQVLGQRNSYSKTDEDATMMRMKDERLLPAYNVQHTTAGQYLVNYTVEQNPSDSVTLVPHLNKMDTRLEGLPVPEEQNLGGDAGYGSEENYSELERRHMTAYVKYPLWYQEQSGELAKKKFRRENWAYDTERDFYTCPNGRKLVFAEERAIKSTNGYERLVRIYKCQSCEDCPFQSECKKSEENVRSVQHSPKGEAYKVQAKERLATDKGLEMRSNRSIEVESAFGDLKYNMKHRRFVLRERHKVYIEFGLLAIGHNLRKVYCEDSGCWAEYYAQRASKKRLKTQKRA